MKTNELRKVIRNIIREFENPYEAQRVLKPKEMKGKKDCLNVLDSLEQDGLDFNICEKFRDIVKDFNSTKDAEDTFMTLDSELANYDEESMSKNHLEQLGKISLYFENLKDEQESANEVIDDLESNNLQEAIDKLYEMSKLYDTEYKNINLQYGIESYGNNARHLEEKWERYNIIGTTDETDEVKEDDPYSEEKFEKDIQGIIESIKDLSEQL